MSNIEQALTSARFGLIMGSAVTDTDIVALYQEMEARDAAQADDDAGTAG